MIQRAPELVRMEAMGEAAECLRTMAHPSRLQMLQLLCRGHHTVGELAQACNIASNAASDHLRLLKDRGMLRKERDGHRVFYRVAHERVGMVMQFVQSYFPQETSATG